VTRSRGGGSRVTWPNQGFGEIRVDARYERYADTSEIAGYLGAQLTDAGRGSAASALVDWAAEPSSMFAQTWVSATGVRI
jgi:hypothetical protein